MNHICGFLIAAKIITAVVRHIVTKGQRQVHSYEADVTFVASAEVLQVGGSGPSFRLPRTQAYQQLLLMMCGYDGKDVALTSAPLPRAELIATAGGRIPHATVLKEADPTKTATRL